MRFISSTTVEHLRIRQAPKRFDWLWPGVLLTACFAVYEPCLGYDFFTFDDPVYIGENRSLVAADGLARIWSRLRVRAGCPNPPITLTSFWLEHRIWGKRPTAFHATNVVLHACAAWFFGLWLRALGLSRLTSAAAAGWFAVHPLHVDSVVWISERKNVLSGAFFFLALYVHARWEPPMRPASIAYGLFAALAMLSKNACVVLPVVAVATDGMLLGRRFSAAALRRQCVPLLLAAAVGTATMAVEGDSGFVRDAHLPWRDRAVLAPAAILFYGWKTIWPGDLQFFYPEWRPAAVERRWQLPAAVLLGVLAALFAFRRRSPLVIQWGLAVAVVMLLPVCGWKAFGWWQFHFVSNHLAYLGSAGVLAAVAGLAGVLANRSQALAMTGVVAATVALGVLARERVIAWRDPEALMGDVQPSTHRVSNLRVKAEWMLTLPEKRQSLRTLLKSMAGETGGSATEATFAVLVDLDIRESRLELARRHAEEAVAKWPNRADSFVVLANVLLLANEYDAALVAFQKALVIQSRPDVLRNLGYLSALRGDSAAAQTFLERAVDLDPDDFAAWLNLGQVYMENGRAAPAVNAFRTALALDPASATAKEGLLRMQLRTTP